MPATGIARVDGQELPYTLRPEDGTYVFEVDGGRYRFRQWTWGEKNRVIDAATVADPAGGRMRLDVARFNELMLAASLAAAEGVEEVTPAALRRLNPVLGDALLVIAYWVNELPAGKKKSLRSAVRGGHSHPDLISFRLCREFGWTPRQVRAQRAVDVEEMVLILEEMDTLSTLVSADEDTTTILIAED